MNPDAVFKTLVAVGASRKNYVFVIPVARELDLRKAAKAAGEKSVALIPVREITALTGYVRGGCSPVGMNSSFRPGSMKVSAHWRPLLSVPGRSACRWKWSPEN